MKFSGLNFKFCLLLGLLTLGAAGCRSTVRVTDTEHAGSEQLLLNASADAVVQCIDFSPLVGRLCYLETAGLGVAADGYLAFRIRKQMGNCGVRLAESREDAELVVEAGLSAYGTDSNKNAFGISDNTQLPEVNLCVHYTQYAVAQLSMFALERDSGSVVWNAEPMRADSYQDIRKCLGLGPYYSGTIEHSANRVERDDSKHLFH